MISFENNNGEFFFVEIVCKVFVIGYPLGAHDFALVLGVVSKTLFFKIFKFKYCKQGFFHPVIFRPVLNPPGHELVILIKYNKTRFVQSLIILVMIRGKGWRIISLYIQCQYCSNLALY